MTSSILNSAEICRLVEDEGMIEDFNLNSFDGLGSYDFRAGETVYVMGETKGKDPEPIHLEKTDSLSLQPGHAYAIASKEKLNLPENIQVQLSLRFRLAAKKLLYPGGFVDPGYADRLLFVVYNLSSTDYTIQYGDPLVRGEFRRINGFEDNTTLVYNEDTREISELITKEEGFEDGPLELLPESPSRSQEYRDLEMMNHDLDEAEQKLTDLNQILNEFQKDVQNLNETDAQTSSKIDRLEEEISSIKEQMAENSAKVNSNEENYKQIRQYLEYLVLVVLATVIATATFAIVTSSL